MQAESKKLQNESNKNEVKKRTAVFIKYNNFGRIDYRPSNHLAKLVTQLVGYKSLNDERLKYLKMIASRVDMHVRVLTPVSDDDDCEYFDD